MRDPFRDAFNRMRHAGADPRRADPRFVKPIILRVRQAAAFGLMCIVGGVALGIAGTAVLALVFDLRPASTVDIRLARIVRAAVSDADALSQDDLVARLAVPPPVGRLLAPLAATDSARAAITSSWLAGLQDAPPPVTTPERMRALGEIATGLAQVPEPDRNDLIQNLVDLYRATRDPSSRTVIATVAGLPRDRRDRLAGSLALSPLLAAIADLPEAKREALADGGLDLLPDDPERLRLIRSIPTLDPAAVRLVNELADITDPLLRQALIFVVNAVRTGSPKVLRLLTAFYCGETDVLAALAHPSPGTCRRPTDAR